MVVVDAFWPLSAFSFVMAIIALAYYRFAKPGEVLGWWATLVNKAYDEVIAHASVKYNKTGLYFKYEWALKPILTCEKCIAGQVSLWAFLLCIPYDTLSLLYVVGLSSYLASWLYRQL